MERFRFFKNKNILTVSNECCAKIGDKNVLFSETMLIKKDDEYIDLIIPIINKVMPIKINFCEGVDSIFDNKYYMNIKLPEKIDDAVCTESPCVFTFYNITGAVSLYFFAKKISTELYKITITILFEEIKNV